MIRADLTEVEKQQDLEDQYVALRRDPKKIVFCPWCSGINRAPQEGEPPAPACCPQFAMGVELIGQKQLQSVIAQQKEILLGAKKTIHCPYCGFYNRPYSRDPEAWSRPMVSPFCCTLLHDAALAIAQRMDLERLTEQKKRIEDAVAGGLKN